MAGLLGGGCSALIAKEEGAIGEDAWVAEKEIEMELWEGGTRRAYLCMKVWQGMSSSPLSASLGYTSQGSGHALVSRTYSVERWTAPLVGCST